MARLLQRLGAFSVRRRRLVLGSWLLGLVVLAGLAVAFKGTFSDEFKVPGTESQRAIELIEQAVPQANADGATGRVVFASDAKLDEAAMGAAVKQLAAVPGVGLRDRRRSSHRTAGSPTPTCSSRSPRRT